MKVTCTLGMLAAIVGIGCARGAADDLGDDLESTVAEDGGASGTSLTPPSNGARDAGTSDTGAAVAAEAGTDGNAPSSCAFAGALVSFDLSGLSGSPADVSPSASAPGVTASVLKRAGVTAVSSSGAFNASGWPTGAVDKTKYFAFSVTPPAGCAITLTKLSLTLDASNTGPKSASVGTSADSYGVLRSAPITAAAADVALSGIVGVSGPVEIRVYGFQAQSSAGTLRIDDALSLTGALVSP